MRTDLEQLPAVSIAESLGRAPGIVDLWCFFYEPVEADARLFAEYEALLSPDERERHTRYRFERDRRQFLATRALARSVLSNYSAATPADWRFAFGERGKPRIAAPEVEVRPHFNLANTAGLVVCAVSLAHEVLGVDVERLDRSNDILALSDRYFCPSEARAVRSLSASERPRRFFDYWTLKESYIKACGHGLAIPLDSFGFQVDGERIRIDFDERRDDDAARWRFQLVDAPPRHVIAVGVETGGAELSLRAARVVPLRDGN